MFDYVFEISFEVYGEHVSTWTNVVTTYGRLGYMHISKSLLEM
jgi:hypothetical protein